MTETLPDRRARFLLDPGRAAVLRTLANPLQDAPLRVRRLGLPLAVAMWSREGRSGLVDLLANWLFDQWGMLGNYPVPQDVAAMLDELMDIAQTAPALRSALEVEAEALLQAAKILSAALTGRHHG